MCLMTENSAEISNRPQQEFTKPNLEPGFLSSEEQETFEHLCEARAKGGKPWFMFNVNTPGPTRIDQLVKKVIAKVAWDNGDFTHFLNGRQRHLLYSNYLAQPRETHAQIAKKESVSRSRAGQITEMGISKIRGVWRRRWENTGSIEVPQRLPEFYLLTPAMPTWFREVDLLDLGSEIRSKLAENGLVKLDTLYEADYDTLNACGFDTHDIGRLRGVLEEFANTLIRFKDEREGQISEEILNNQAVSQKEVPPYFLDRRLKNHWREFEELDLLRLPTNECHDLKRGGVKGIRELDLMSNEELLEIRQLGQIGLKKIRTLLREFKWQRLGLLD